MNVILVLVIVTVAMGIVSIVLYSVFNSKLNRAINGVLKIVEGIDKEVKHERKLFADHFKTTDETIEDTRKERDYWKTKALKKKSATLKK